MKKLIILFAFIVNSSLVFSQNIFGDVLCIWDSITFETPFNCIQIDTSSQNLWQVGIPQKTFFDSAYSVQNAIITNTVSSYPVNNHSYFDLIIDSYNFPNCFSSFYPVDIYMDFWHKFDTDTLKDGGYITVSWDKGQTWMNVIKDTAYFLPCSPAYPIFQFDIENMYNINNLLFNGEYGFSGRSNNWVHTVCSWHGIITDKNYSNFPPDTMILRFNFISDSINNPHEGWMIDNIRIYSMDIIDYANSISNNDELTVFPNPAQTNSILNFITQTNNIKDIEFYNMVGEKVMTKHDIFRKEIQLGIKLNAGVYIYRVCLTNEKSIYGKIIIE